jgi:hypothetical protein
MTAPNDSTSDISLGTVFATGTEAISFTTAEDEDRKIVLDSPDPYPLSQGAGESVVIRLSVSGNIAVSSVHWLVDGQDTDIEGTEFTLVAADYAPGVHYLAAEMLLNGAWYSRELRFRVMGPRDTLQQTSPQMLGSVIGIVGDVLNISDTQMYVISSDSTTHYLYRYDGALYKIDEVSTHRANTRETMLTWDTETNTLYASFGLAGTASWSNDDRAYYTSADLRAYQNDKMTKQTKLPWIWGSMEGGYTAAEWDPQNKRLLVAGSSKSFGAKVVAVDPSSLGYTEVLVVPPCGGSSWIPVRLFNVSGTIYTAVTQSTSTMLGRMSLSFFKTTNGGGFSKLYEGYGPNIAAYGTLPYPVHVFDDQTLLTATNSNFLGITNQARLDLLQIKSNELVSKTMVEGEFDENVVSVIDGDPTGYWMLQLSRKTKEYTLTRCDKTGDSTKTISNFYNGTEHFFAGDSAQGHLAYSVNVNDDRNSEIWLVTDH